MVGTNVPGTRTNTRKLPEWKKNHAIVHPAEIPSDFSEACYLAKKTELYIPDNEILRTLITQSSVNINITTDPPGAEVFVKLYNQPNTNWQRLGTAPIDSIQVPIG